MIKSFVLTLVLLLNSGCSVFSSLSRMEDATARIAQSNADLKIAQNETKITQAHTEKVFALMAKDRATAQRSVTVLRGLGYKIEEPKND